MSENEVKELNLEHEVKEMSRKIATAINPITTKTAPIVVMLLESYAEELKKDSRFSNTAYQYLKSMAHVESIVADGSKGTLEDFLNFLKEKGL